MSSHRTSKEQIDILYADVIDLAREVLTTNRQIDRHQFSFNGRIARVLQSNDDNEAYVAIRAENCLSARGIMNGMCGNRASVTKLWGRGLTEFNVDLQQMIEMGTTEPLESIRIERKNGNEVLNIKPDQHSNSHHIALLKGPGVAYGHERTIRALTQLKEELTGLIASLG